MAIHHSMPGRSRQLRNAQKVFAIAGLIAAMLFAAGCSAGEMPAREVQLRHFVKARYGSDAAYRFARWREMVAVVHDENESAKLARVNDFFNRIPYVADMGNWGVTDYWATPLEMLAVNGGDCEDYAIAKYFSLLEMGVPPDRLRLWYVNAASRGENHMVLAYQSDATVEPLILDNLTDEIKPASTRNDLLRLFSFNADGIWAARTDRPDEKIGRPERLPQWFDLLLRRFREMRRIDLAGATSGFTAAGLTAQAGPIRPD